jgi:predicted dehydrogenase
MAGQCLDVYRDLDWVRVASCIDIDLERAQHAGDAVSAQRVTSDFRAALSGEVEAVIINTPNHVHRPPALAAIRAGKHVLLQKPVAAKLRDADEIANAARRSDRTIGVYMSYFDQPLMHDARDMVSKGYLGDVVHFYARFMHRGG